MRNNKIIDVNVEDTPRIYIKTPNGEISVHYTSTGELRISADENIVIAPQGSNAINLELRK